MAHSYVKEHMFFSEAIEDEDGINWDELLQEKACFVPDLEDDLDTSYFDNRRDRYNRPSSSSSSGGSDDEAGGAPPPNLGMFRNFSCINLSTSLSTTSSTVGSLTPRRRSSIQDDLEDYRLISPSPPRRNAAGLGAVPTPTPPPISRLMSSPAPCISVSPPSNRVSRADMPSPVHGAQSPPSVQMITPPSPSMPHSSNLIRRRAMMRTLSPFAPADSGSAPVAASHSPLRPKPAVAAASVPLINADSALNSKTAGGSKATDRRPRPEPLCMLGCAKCTTVQVEWTEQHGFGFGIRTIHTATGNRHCIVHVDVGGPGEAAGMEAHYAVIQVNGVTILPTDSHQKVARLINTFRGCVTAFHLLDISSEIKANKKTAGPKEALLRRIANSFTRDRDKSGDKEKKPKKSKKVSRLDMGAAVVSAGSVPLAVGEPRWELLTRLTRSPSQRSSPTRQDSVEKKDKERGSASPSNGASFMSSLKRSASRKSQKKKKEQQQQEDEAAAAAAAANAAANTASLAPVISAPDSLAHLLQLDFPESDAEFSSEGHIARSDSQRSAGSVGSTGSSFR
jgi:microtubule-associated serine/threonine kinase